MDTNLQIAFVCFGILVAVLIFASVYFTRDSRREAKEARRQEQQRAMERPITHTFKNHVVTYKLDRTHLVSAMHGLATALSAGHQIDEILAANPNTDLKNYESELGVKIIRHERGPAARSADLTVLGD